MVSLTVFMIVVDLTCIVKLRHVSRKAMDLLAPDAWRMRLATGQ